MKDWEMFDDYMLYNEKEKRVVYWTTYGDNDEYFLSREYYYENDDFLENDGLDTYVLVNEQITDKVTLSMLINKTKEMVI